jgi:hypothetical protein
MILFLKRSLLKILFSEYDDDIYPYATFQAWKPVSQVSSQRGFKTFICQGSDSPGVNSYAPGEVSEGWAIAPVISESQQQHSLEFAGVMSVLIKEHRNNYM